MIRIFGQVRLSTWLLVLLGVGWLSACGKTTDTQTNDSSVTTPNGTVFSIALARSSDGAATTSISSASPGTIKVNIKLNDSTYPQNVLVTFGTDLGTLNPAVGTSLTNSSGDATMQLLSDGTTGAGTVTATASVGGESLSVSLNFSVTSSALAGRTLSVVLKDSSGTATSSVSADASGTLTATVADASGIGVRDVIVVFTTNLGVLAPSSGTAITNAAGQASVALGFKDALGADAVKATASIGAETLATTLNYQVAPPTLRMGYTGSAFTPGVVGIGTSPLSPGGTTGLSVNIVDANGAAFTVPITVKFTSNCAAVGKSSIDAAVATINGQAVVTYRAKGCVGVDTVVASADFGGSSFSAQANLTVNADVAGSIEFLSATPTLIAIMGTGAVGLSETSSVLFKVKSTQGMPVANQLVSFALNTSVGGLVVAPASGYTNSSGEIDTVVRSGAVATGVRVTASAVVGAVTLTSQSSQLTVSTGLPDQNSTSITASILNPEGFDWDGATVTINARLADHFNNPVPNGTAVYFTTEGGAVESSCLTDKGGCSVIWTSQDPRPIDHRATVLMTVVGNESFFDEDGNGSYSDSDGEPYNDANRNGVLDEPFTDSNGNGKFDEPFSDTNGSTVYDFGEPFIDYNHNGYHDGAANNPAGETTFTDRNGNGFYDGAGTAAAVEAYTDANGNSAFDGPGFADVAEAFLDQNETRVRDQGEPYFDFNNNGQYDLRDGAYGGALCTHATLCAAQNTVHVRDSIVIVMSGSDALIVAQNAATPSLIYASNVPDILANSTLSVAAGSTKKLNISITDKAGQSLPVSTQVTISADVGVLKGEASFTILNNVTGGRVAAITVEDDDPDPAATASGVITIKVETPKGVITELVFNLGV